MSGTAPAKLDQQKFGTVVVTALWLLFLPFILATGIFADYFQAWVFSAMQGEPQPSVLGLPLIAIGVGEVGFLSFGPQSFGLISVFGVGLVSFGGVGIVSFGGVALGVIALGGAACGVVAIGGGALGYVAVGGGAYGVYVL